MAQMKMTSRFAISHFVGVNLLALQYIGGACHGFGIVSAPLHATMAEQQASIVYSHQGTASPIMPPFQSSAQSWLDNDSSITSSSSLLASSETSTTLNAATNSWADQILHTKKYKTDKVKRVIDASTIQLEKNGYISLESVRGAGSTYQLPDCMDKSPSFKLRRLLPKGTNIRFVSLNDIMKSGDGQSTSSSSSTTPRVWIIRSDDELLVNQELVRSGFALVRKGSKGAPDMMNDLLKLEQSAKEQGLGIYKSCDGVSASSDNADSNSLQTSNFVAEFEPLDFVTEIQYGDDGGKSVIVSTRPLGPVSPPANPGDIKGCSDFRTYEEALGWYETYFPYYRDVARLDRDNDGVPCPGLPHTTVAEKYRMKVPTNSGSKSN